VIAIREMQDADEPAVIALWQAAGVSRPWNPLERDIAFARRGPHSAILLGLDGTRLIATTMVGEDGHRGWVYYVAVDPASQGSGAGRAMMAAAEAWLQARGVWKVQLMVRADNTGVHDFYKALGYEAIERVIFQKSLI
jgi:ribosomal protein S18 acetylase RimI-like enzyme